MDKEYIDREAALRAILGQPPDAHYPGWYADSIKEIPAADVATVVHGEWINCNGGNATCSHCKTRQKNVYDDNEQRFCGHCGAKMDGGKK